MMSLGASKLEVEKKRRLIYPLVTEPQTASKRDVSNEYQEQKSKHFEHDEMQCKTEVTNTLRTEFSS